MEKTRRRTAISGAVFLDRTRPMISERRCALMLSTFPRSLSFRRTRWRGEQIPLHRYFVAFNVVTHVFAQDLRGNTTFYAALFDELLAEDTLNSQPQSDVFAAHN
jgi:hypothetical protein